MDFEENSDILSLSIDMIDAFSELAVCEKVFVMIKEGEEMNEQYRVGIAHSMDTDNTLSVMNHPLVLSEKLWQLEEGYFFKHHPCVNTTDRRISNENGLVGTYLGLDCYCFYSTSPMGLSSLVNLYKLKYNTSDLKFVIEIDDISNREVIKKCVREILELI